MSMGWHIILYRQGMTPATPGCKAGERVADWDVDMWGLKWLDDLVKEGKAIQIEFNGGYPIRYTAQAEHLAGEGRLYDLGGVWFLIEAWDQS